MGDTRATASSWPRMPRCESIAACRAFLALHRCALIAMLGRWLRLGQLRRRWQGWQHHAHRRILGDVAALQMGQRRRRSQFIEASAGLDTGFRLHCGQDTVKFQYRSLVGRGGTTLSLVSHHQAGHGSYSLHLVFSLTPTVGTPYIPTEWFRQSTRCIARQAPPPAVVFYR